MSNLGWIAGPAILAIFSVVSWYTAHLLADTYQHPKDSGPRNRTYSDAVQAVLGEGHKVSISAQLTLHLCHTMLQS